ncbi:MAG: hypothetical protein WAV20_11195, partial [Blastocatellia bacterium]
MPFVVNYRIAKKLYKFQKVKGVMFMLVRVKPRKLILALVLLSLGLSVQAADDKDNKDKKSKVDGVAVLWREPADIASLNLLLGP